MCSANADIGCRSRRQGTSTACCRTFLSGGCMSKEQLLGHWTIIAWEQRYDDGRRVLPLGPSPEGFIRYDADGRMVCMIARANRQNFAGGAQWTATDDEKARAYSEFLAYAGTY